MNLPPTLTHTLHLTVPPSAIDANGHVNNVAFVHWMQLAAIAHADAVGCTAATKAHNALWVVRKHTIEYRLPAFLDDQLEIRTWIADCRLVSSRRNYEFLRTSDHALLAKGQTDWVLLDATTLQPTPIPEHIQHLYLPPTQLPPTPPQ
jgi:acyl-CoA thioester hydrolase